MATVHPSPGTAPDTPLASARGASSFLLRWSSRALVATVWASGLLFGLYILFFYAGALVDGTMTDWNDVLPGLYSPETPVSTGGIGIHFAAGGIILVLGCIQLLEPVRERFPGLHRWTGRVYVASALLAGLGGLVFIALTGTIGGTVMDVGFGLYGVLTLAAAVQTYRHARAGRLEAHRAWAIRLFALAIGSWLYRMDYGFWSILTGGVGHTGNFDGPFDRVMAFFFYVPNLLVAEAFIRARRFSAPPALRYAAAAALAGATLFILIGTYYFTRIFWWPGIVSRVIG